MKEVLNGFHIEYDLDRLDSLLYTVCVLEEDVSQLRMVSLSKVTVNNTIEKRQQLFDHQ
jgi:hypothetical protein